MLLRMTLLSVTEQAFVVLIFSKQSQNCYSGFETTRNLHWKSLQHRLLGWIRIREVSTGNLRVSLRHTIRQANIVVREKFHQSHLDFISGKKAPRTRMPAVSKSHVVFISRDELGACLVTRRMRVNSFYLMLETVKPTGIMLRVKVSVHRES